jgi:hypothetical protein
MFAHLRSKLTYSNVIATIALFVALGGAAVAARLPAKSVGPKQLKRGAVTTSALRKGAVTSAKLAQKSVIPGKLAANSVLTGTIGNGAVTAEKLASSAVTAAKLANNAVGSGKLANNAVTTVKIANGAVTLAKLGSDVAPLLGTLQSGQTLRGMFNIGESGSGPTEAGQSFQFPLLNAPTASVIDPATATTAACPGITGGNGQTPQAAAGQLCIYVTSKTNLTTLTAPGVALTRLGFGLEATGTGPFVASGQWAVTAP